jgi:hypothetical protein
VARPTRRALTRGLNAPPSQPTTNPPLFSNCGRIVSMPITPASSPRWQAIPRFSVTVDGLHAVHSFQRREGEKGRFGALQGSRRAEVVHSLSTGRSPRASPQALGGAPRGAGPKAPRTVERQSAARAVVEGTDPESKLSLLQTRSASSIRGTSGQADVPRIEPSLRCQSPPHVYHPCSGVCTTQIVMLGRRAQ